MKCKYCERLCKNGNSLRNHERLCKLNPNKQGFVSNFIAYNQKICDGSIIKEYTNQFTKSQKLGIPIFMSNETKEKIIKSNTGRKLSVEQKEKISISMKLAVLKYPDSYTANNVCGRVKNIEYNGFILKGNWEFDVAKWLDLYKIRWTNKVSPFRYEWNNSTHLYYPDFYLIDYDYYIEVKGYERERDRCKWSVVKNLYIIRKKEIAKIRNNSFNLDFIHSLSSVG